MKDTNPITSIEFFNTWKEVVENRKEELLEVWQNSTAFTSKIFHDDNSILQEIAEKLTLNVYTSNYYFLDAVFYEDQDLVPDINKNNFWLKDIHIAFEHENYFKSGLFQEVSHLLLTNCELRVLVSYPNGDYKPELDYLHKIIKSSSQEELISQKENFLIILGSETNFQWQAFYYKTADWKEIK